MGRMCPLGGYALYLDCLECDDKVCKKGSAKVDKTNKQSEYFKKVDSLMRKRGYMCCMIKGANTEYEEHCYQSIHASEKGAKNHIAINVRKRREFNLFYSNIKMCAQLITPWCGSINNDKHFECVMNKFIRSVEVLMEEWHAT